MSKYIENGQQLELTTINGLNFITPVKTYEGQVVFPVADVATLEALVTSDSAKFFDGVGVIVKSLNQLFTLNLTSNATAVTGKIIVDGSSHRWINVCQVSWSDLVDVNGKIPSQYLPSYVDDVLEFANLAAMPETGVQGIIYVAIDTNKTYRWSGSAYIEISSSEVTSVNSKTGAVVLTTDDIVEGTTNKYYTDGRAEAVAQTVVGQALTGNTFVNNVATVTQDGVAFNRALVTKRVALLSDLEGLTVPNYSSVIVEEEAYRGEYTYFHNGTIGTWKFQRTF